VLHDTSTAARPEIAALIGRPSRKTAIACCGPASMIDDFEQASRDWPEACVHIERFVPPVLPADPDARPYTLALSRSNLETRVDPGQTMLPHCSASASIFRRRAAAAFAAPARSIGWRGARSIATACCRRRNARAA